VSYASDDDYDAYDPATPAERPTPAEVRAWIDVPTVELTPGQLADVYYAEAETQAAYNETDPYTWGLRMALMRRCARSAAARGLPLGTLPVQMTGYPDAHGALIIPRLDAEIERYEGPTRVIPIA
jgi:hypothetical protein